MERLSSSQKDIKENDLFDTIDKIDITQYYEDNFGNTEIGLEKGELFKVELNAD